MESVKKYIILNAALEDYENISKLFYSVKTHYFGRHRKKDTLQEVFFGEYSTYRLLIPLTIAKYIIIGYAEVSNSPNLPALSGNLWQQFITYHFYCNLPLSATNTCFLNKFVYHVDHTPEMLKQLLEEIFHRQNQLQYILVLECPDYRRYTGKDVRNYSCLMGISAIFYPKCFSAITCSSTPKLHVITRHSILPPIRFRRALPGDNDDIVAIVNQDNPLIQAKLGEYYVAEHLLSDSTSSFIVTEINNITAGFMWLNDTTDLVYLLENYYLQCFGNFLKFDPRERFKEIAINVNAAQRRSFDNLFTTEAVNGMCICSHETTSSKDVSVLRLVQELLPTISFHSENNISSLCSFEMASAESGTIENDKKIGRRSIQTRWQELNEIFKSSHYYVQIREEPLRLFYNTPDDENNTPWEVPSNAFVLELFGLLDSFDCRRVFEFLLAAFAAYPDKDYCLLAIGVVQQTIPVLVEILKYFVPVAFRPKCAVEEHLFVSYRGAVFGDLSLFAATLDDSDDIINIFKNDVGGDDSFGNTTDTKTFPFENVFDEEFATRECDFAPFINTLKNVFNDPFSVYKCFTIRCGDSTRPMADNTIVGFVVIRPVTLKNFLQKNFHVAKMNELQSFFNAEIVALKLHNFFHFQAEFIFRELSRQTNYLNFYYFRATNEKDFNKPNDLVTNMQPLEPRSVKKLWFNCFAEPPRCDSDSDSDKDKLINTLDFLKDHFAAFQTNLRPPAYFGSTKNIVIVGFNDICKAFLRLMIFSWHNLSNDTQASINCLPQINITVICGPGVMEADHDYAFKCKSCLKKVGKICWIDFKNSDAFIRDVCDRLDVRTWVKFVSGKIKSIDGDKHLITMRSECEIYYEILLLMCGTDFGIPHGIFKDTDRPPNYCHFNSRFDKILFYHKLELLQNNLPGDIKRSIVVYGGHLRTFEFVNFLLQHGIKGSEINLILPHFEHTSIPAMDFMLNISSQDARVLKILSEMALDLGVQIYEGMNFSEYKMCENELNLQKVTFKNHSSNEEMTVECDLFISFYEVSLSESLLEVFKTADIQTAQNFVLVNENYETSVSKIYAMGNFIKHKVEPNHQYRFVNQQEAAEKVIEALGLFDSQTTTERKFSKPSYFQAQVGLEYLLVKITIPKRYLANHSENDYKLPLATYREGEFARVRLNEWDIVEEIVIVTRKLKNYDFLKFFCGRHELLLNNLKARWQIGKIASLTDFFQESWTELLMHDDFESLRIINKSFIAPAAQEVAEKDVSRNEKRKILNDLCHKMGISTDIEYTFLEFLRQHREDFCTDIALPEDFIQSNAEGDEF